MFENFMKILKEWRKKQRDAKADSTDTGIQKEIDKISTEIKNAAEVNDGKRC